MPWTPAGSTSGRGSCHVGQDDQQTPDGAEQGSVAWQSLSAPIAGTPQSSPGPRRIVSCCGSTTTPMTPSLNRTSYRPARNRDRLRGRDGGYWGRPSHRWPANLRGTRRRRPCLASGSRGSMLPAPSVAEWYRGLVASIACSATDSRLMKANRRTLHGMGKTRVRRASSRNLRENSSTIAGLSAARSRCSDGSRARL